MAGTRDEQSAPKGVSSSRVFVV